MTVIGLLAETKEDRRTPLDPTAAAGLRDRFGVRVLVETSGRRAFDDDAYRAVGLEVVDGVPDADILFGVKEVAIDRLLPDRTYLYFSHVIKKQPYNRAMMRTVIERRIRLIDYETITGTNGVRLLGFGRWAGIVGAYEGLRADGRKTGRFDLPAAAATGGLGNLLAAVRGIDPGSLRVALTGGGRVSSGAEEVLRAAGIAAISAPGLVAGEAAGQPVFARLEPGNYARRRDGGPFAFADYVGDPQAFETAFPPFASATDLLISGHFWDPKAPRLFERDDVAVPEFKIRTVADITCDIDGSVPTTIRATDLGRPCYDVDRRSLGELAPYSADGITVMAVDNLPAALPGDASADFGAALLDQVFPALLGDDADGRIARATIAEAGRLTGPFQYLADYALA